MPTYKEVVGFEEEAPSGVIRLVRSGEFYRAYNRSAWLFHCCIARHKVLRKYVKALESDIFYIGFPVQSLQGNVGSRVSETTDFGVDVHLAEDEIPAEDGYETWKASLKAAESSQGDFYSLPLAGADAEREAVRRLREFPLESKSMVECAVFLAELRRLLSNK